MFCFLLRSVARLRLVDIRLNTVCAGGGGQPHVPRGGGGGGGRLGLNHARMCVSKSEVNGFFFGFK